nr:universal stress protein [Gemmatimonadaceae bacterium]
WSPRRILVPLDGSATAEHVLDILAAVPGLRSTPIVLVSALVPSTLLGIVPPDVMVDDATSDVDLVAMRAELATVAEACVARGLARPAVHVALGAARDVILDALSDHDADLIAMTTRGRSGLARAVLGSTADAIVRVSPVPVLLVTPGDRPA